MKPTIICYSKCGTCRKALKWLDDNAIDHSSRPIKEDNPTKEELTSWLLKSKLPIKKFFNTSGKLYKENNMKDKVNVLTTEELIEILSSDGMMVKRPILLAGDRVLVGFKEEDWKTALL